MSSVAIPEASIVVWADLGINIDRKWEAAYQRFETPQQEIAKFKRRLVQLGYMDWAKDTSIVELFCGRGNGIHALTQLGFQNVEGVDLSLELLQRYQGSAKLYAGDCRQLQFDTSSRDCLIVQGGLHHLPSLPNDLEMCLDEIRRVLKSDGYFCMVEPWQTPFLKLAHAISDNPVARRCWDKLDALAEMTERELSTYTQWLGMPETILDCIKQRFVVERKKIAFGKLLLRARPRK
ncbi:MAG: class I SAM-dependent methyltransferase [Pirellulales bacterium]